MRKIGKKVLSGRPRYPHARNKNDAQSKADRSEAGREGHDTRTRKEGMRQVASGIIDLSSPVLSTVKAGKDIGLGTAKVIAPRKVRKNKVAKGLDII